VSSIAFVDRAAAKCVTNFGGRLLKPAGTGYEEARKFHNGLVDKRPALIVGYRGRVAYAINLIRPAFQTRVQKSATPSAPLERRGGERLGPDS
jgi:hypothetical protein